LTSERSKEARALPLDILAHSVSTNGSGDLVVQGSSTPAIIDAGMISFDGGVTFQSYTYLGQGNYRGNGQSGEFIQVGSQIYGYATDDPTGPLQNGNWKIKISDLDPNMPPCFVRGTSIRTPDGEVAIEELGVEDLVTTASGRQAPILWSGYRRVAPSQMKRNPALRPVRINQDVLGNELPLSVSQQHRLLIGGFRAELWFGESELLVPAKAFLACDGVSLAPDHREVFFHHLLLDAHEVIFANGVASESLHLGDQVDEQILQDLEERSPGYLVKAKLLPVAKPIATVQESRVLFS